MCFGDLNVIQNKKRSYHLLMKYHNLQSLPGPSITGTINRNILERGKIQEKIQGGLCQTIKYGQIKVWLQFWGHQLATVRFILYYIGKKRKNTQNFSLLALMWEVKIYRIEIFHPRGTEGFCNFFGCYHACHWVPIAHWFSHCDYVWNEVFTKHLETPEMFPNSAKAYLNFISYKHTSCSTDISEKQKGSMMLSGH